MKNSTKTYRVTYEVHAGGAPRTMTVEAIDAIDAKHVVEFYEGEVVVKASARKENSTMNPEKCEHCNGGGEYVTPGGRGVECPECFGTGIAHENDRDLAVGE